MHADPQVTRLDEEAARELDEANLRFRSCEEADVVRLRDTQERNSGPPDQDKKPKKRFAFIPVGELAASVTAPDWQIRGILEADSLGVVYGAPEVGKSFLAVDWACCIAAGLPWRGHKVKQGSALVIIGEGRNGYTRRLEAWSKTSQTPLPDLPVFVSNMATALTDEMSRVELEAVIAAFMVEHGPPGLVVVDTLARNFGSGDENSTADMGRAVDACSSIREMTGAAVVLVHHSGKASDRGARGSIALRGAADCEYLMVREVDDLIRVEATKMKDAERPEAKAFRFQRVGLGFNDDEGEEVTSAVLQSTECRAPAAAARQPSGKHQRDAMKLLRESYAKHRENVRKSDRDESEARVSVAVWRDVCVSDGMPINRFNDAKRSLVNAGLVRTDLGFVYLVEENDGRF